MIIWTSEETLCALPSDIAWLMAGHLYGQAVPDFGSFLLTGSEAAPDRIELYARSKPWRWDNPIATFDRTEAGAYVRQAADPLGEFLSEGSPHIRGEVSE